VLRKCLFSEGLRGEQRAPCAAGSTLMLRFSVRSRR
jgi:hypothetical protein